MTGQMRVSMVRVRVCVCGKGGVRTHHSLADLNPLVTHVARHVEAGQHTRGGGAGADGAVLPVRLGAVSHQPALHAPPLNGACAPRTEGGVSGFLRMASAHMNNPQSARPCL